jgi:hypothetical protein
MPVLRFKNEIRLTGKDAELYLMMTGKGQLPSTLTEYELAIEQAASNWQNAHCPEGDLLAFLARADHLVERDGSLVKAIDASNPEEALRHILKDLNANLKGTANE